MDNNETPTFECLYCGGMFFTEAALDIHVFDAHNDTKAKTSHSFRFDLIPHEALVRLAERYRFGAEKYGENNYQKSIGDIDYTIERLNHVVEHTFTLIEKLKSKRNGQEVNFLEDDDAAAIMWGGAFACLTTKHVECPE
jgi:hypothetical protein